MSKERQLCVVPTRLCLPLGLARPLYLPFPDSNGTASRSEDARKQTNGFSFGPQTTCISFVVMDGDSNPRKGLLDRAGEPDG
jgi:hypothetical protein